jgi:hypothetical protein
LIQIFWTSGLTNAEEKYRSSLASLYRSQYEPLLFSLKVTEVDVDGEKVKADALFGNEEMGLTDLSVEELMGRRSIVLRIIEEEIGRLRDLKKTAEALSLYDRKQEAMRKEKELDDIFEESLRTPQAPCTPKCFLGVLKCRFLDCSLSCSGTLQSLIFFFNFFIPCCRCCRVLCTKRGSL